jgi:hypothetical protein
VPPAALVDYDRQGHLLWASAQLRDWAYEMERWAAGAAAYEAAQQAAAQPGFLVEGRTESKGMPGWAIALIVVGALVIVGGLLAAIAIPVILVQGDKAEESAVRDGIHRIQIGIQSWAVDHGDRYPSVRLVDQEHLLGYVDDWPENPYTGAPMSLGSGQGDFWYETSPGRAEYVLTGYGAEGIVISVGGPQATY